MENQPIYFGWLVRPTNSPVVATSWLVAGELVGHKKGDGGIPSWTKGHGLPGAVRQFAQGPREVRDKKVDHLAAWVAPCSGSP